MTQLIQRLRQLRLALALLVMVLTVSPARAATGPQGLALRALAERALQAPSICTLYVSPPDPIPLWEAPSVVLCFRAGNYPHAALVRITAIGATYQAAPGEATMPRLVGPGLELSGHDFALSGLEVDNAGAGVPALVLRGDRETVSGNEIHNGGFNGVDVRGSGAVISGNEIHGFAPADRIPGNDAQCVNVLPTAQAGTLSANHIYDCWGDGVQFFTPIQTVYPAAQQLADDWQVMNNTFERGALWPYDENGLDNKGGRRLVISGNRFYGYCCNRVGTGQPAVVLHHDAWDVLFAGNTISNSFQAIQLSAGTWTRLTISGNTIVSTTNYAIELAGCVTCTVSGNTISRAGEALLVAGNGWAGGALARNLFEQSGPPRIAGGSMLRNVTIGSNAWVGTAKTGAFTSLLDVSIAAGFGVATAMPTATTTPSATVTATASPSQTPTPTATSTLAPTSTQTPTATATAIPTLSGCWDLRHSPPLTIPCPG